MEKESRINTLLGCTQEVVDVESFEELEDYLEIIEPKEALDEIVDI